MQATVTEALHVVFTAMPSHENKVETRE